MIMTIVFAVFLLAWAAFFKAISIPLTVWARRRAAGIPWRFQKIETVLEKTPFPRGLFRMTGMTGGPTPLKAPLSGKECFFYELVFYPESAQKREGISLLSDGKEFTFFSPKGAVTLNPQELSRESHVAMKIQSASRVPLPKAVREKIQTLGRGDEGSLEERVIPAFQELLLIGRAQQVNPQTWRLKKGPGIFPLVSAENKDIYGLSPAGAQTMSFQQTLQVALLLAGSFAGMYFFWAYTLSR